MSERMRWIFSVAALSVAVVLLGWCALRAGTQSETTTSSTGVPAPADIARDGGVVAEQYGAGGAANLGTKAIAPAAGAISPDSLVITTAGMAVEVGSLDPAVAAVRTVASRYGATIENLIVSSGGQTPSPQPVDGGSSRPSDLTPGNATVVLRVPAAKLDAVERDLSGLGTVTSQSSTQDDVTQQHIDMAARLKNLQAEEARLRSFFGRATKVSEMLAIEQELARVRGEIESLQAQIAYLERQAARATLTLTLTEPGALVSPGTGGWGFAQAIRDGVRAAAQMTASLITFVLALSPIVALGLLLWFVVRTIVRARREHRDPGVATPDLSETDQPAGDAR